MKYLVKNKSYAYIDRILIEEQKQFQSMNDINYLITQSYIDISYLLNNILKSPSTNLIAISHILYRYSNKFALNQCTDLALKNLFSILRYNTYLIELIFNNSHNIYSFFQILRQKKYTNAKIIFQNIPLDILEKILDYYIDESLEFDIPPVYIFALTFYKFKTVITKLVELQKNKQILPVINFLQTFEVEPAQERFIQLMLLKTDINIYKTLDTNNNEKNKSI